ncbi:hypothetical protein R4Z10_11060 [Niallia sp. XMNu-256]|uniref:hypothetical protein n=1 Tax=Niallia sp. XMNu-256 TaxID=3082444 RepID=UPI0030CAF5C9
MSNNAEKTYQFVASLTESEDKNEFNIEIFSLSEDSDEPSAPEIVIHNFDELISFFEELDDTDFNETEKVLESIFG